MSRERVQTLFHPFESGELDFPASSETCLVFGAERDFSVPEGFEAALTFVQGFRPNFLALKRRGLNVLPQAEGSGYAIALIMAGRHRGQNERRLADAIQRIAPRGLVVMAGGKTEGIASLRKRLEKILPLGGSLSKSHGVAFWFIRGPEANAFAETVILEQDRVPWADGRFESAPGMFSHDRIDAGSRLLGDTLRTEIRGKAADFCAGWGYLSAMLAERTEVSSIDLYEADYASLDAARRNMARLAPGLSAGFHWCDLTTEKVERIYDVIVMNPPFHQGRAAEPDLGQAMIRAAAAALKPHGLLMMVANRGLPYEMVLKSQFSTSKIVAEDKGFRVYLAR